MTSSPMQLTLEIRPQARFDVVDVSRNVREEVADFFARYGKTLYCSHHTTAGYLEQSLCARLGYNRERLSSFVRIFQQIFPPDAAYKHDEMHLRRELDEDQRRVEPRNADSHLAFIGSGLRNCVVYRNRPDAAAYFIDLDGVHEHGTRTRKTTVLGYTSEETVLREAFSVAVSKHPIDAVNLRDQHVGLFEWLDELVRHHEVLKGRIDITLDPAESHSGLTVNEYETLLMRHDLAEVLHDPLRFMADQGRKILRDPRALPYRTLNFARYDLVQVLNQLMDLTGMSESILERAVAKFLAVPAQRFLRMKRGVSLLIAAGDRDDVGNIIQGAYQSPLLVQWSRASSRRLQIELVRFS